MGFSVFLFVTGDYTLNCALVQDVIPECHLVVQISVGSAGPVGCLFDLLLCISPGRQVR